MRVLHHTRGRRGRGEGGKGVGVDEGGGEGEGIVRSSHQPQCFQWDLLKDSCKREVKLTHSIKTIISITVTELAGGTFGNFARTEKSENAKA